MKKKVLFVLLALVMCFTLVGCGNNESTNSGNGNSGTSGGSEQSGGDLKTVSTSNYKSVVKDLFGIDIIDVSGWEIEKAESPNKVNNLNLDFKITTSSDGKEIVEQYYNKAVDVSSDGVYTYSYNNETYKMIKDTKYNSFEECYEKSSNNDDFHQISFIYDYNGKNIYFTMTIREDLSVADISFTYC